jgi:hypothetical protein
MQPYRDPDQPRRPEDVDPTLLELTTRLQARSGMPPLLMNSSLGCLVILAALGVAALLVQWGLQSLGIYQP